MSENESGNQQNEITIAKKTTQKIINRSLGKIHSYYERYLTKSWPDFS